MKRFRALGAYIFAGGHTIGVKKHFDVDTHFEEGTYGVETAMRNKLIVRAYMEPDDWPVHAYRGKVDWVYSNPPCAPWSVCSAGRSTHWTEDPRLNAVKRVWGLLDALEPDVWSWESVRPAWTKGRALVETIVEQAMKRGYSATALFVDGVNHGVPQRRPRFFLVLSRYVMPWEPTHVKPVTVGDAFKVPFKTETCYPLDPRQLKLLKKAEPGERLHTVFNRLNAERVANREMGQKIAGRPSFQRVRLLSDRASHTLTGGAHLIHPTKDRLISVEESAVLCGYPRSFKFFGAMGKQYAQVAQAVMPPVAEYLARMVRKGLEERRRIKTPYYQSVHVDRNQVIEQTLTPLGGSMDLTVKNPVIEMTRASDAKGLPKGRLPTYGIRPGAIREQGERRPAQGSGYRIRCLLKEGKKTTEQILAVIHKEFPGSKAKASDVYWNKRKLESQGGVP